MENRRVDCSVALHRVLPELVGREVKLEVTTRTYLPKGELDSGWFPNIAKGYMRLARARRRAGLSSRVFASIGIGPGLEAILAAHLLQPRLLVLCDVHEDIVRVASSNVRRFLPADQRMVVEAAVSDLCQAIMDRRLPVDVLHENLPNLPASDVDEWGDLGAASFFRRDKAEVVPDVYSAWRLAMHYLFLRQAIQCLAPGGAAVCCIGSRVPNQVVRRLFAEAGLQGEVLSYALVRQYEADDVLPGYVKAEREKGIAFRFFASDKVQEAVEAADEALVPVDDVLDMPALRRAQVSAEEAAQLHARGVSIGHVGIVWLATRAGALESGREGA